MSRRDTPRDEALIEAAEVARDEPLEEWETDRTEDRDQHDTRHDNVEGA